MSTEVRLSDDDPEEEGGEGRKLSDERVSKENVAQSFAQPVSSSSSSVDAEFRRGLEELVRDHLDSCMALASAHDPGIGSSGSNTIARAASFQNLADDDSGCTSTEMEDECREESRRESRDGQGGSRHSQILSRWYERRAEQVITTMERQARQAELLALAGLHAVSMLDPSFLRDSQPRSGSGRSQGVEVERPHPQGRRTSPLVQMWRGLEGGRDRTSSSSSFHAQELRTSVQQSHEQNVPASTFEIDQSAAGERTEIGETARASVRQIIDRWMNERVATSPDSRRSQLERDEIVDLNERESVREMARDWLRSTSQSRADSESEVTEDLEAARRRDRQLILDLLMRTERERQQELEGLSEHRVVSDFPHRGRLQSLLRGRFLVNRIRQEEEDNLSSSARELGQLRQRRAVSGLREGFRLRLETIVRGQASVASDTSRSRDEETPESVTRWTQRVNPLEDNVELRELLGRRSVTNILASEFRDRLDHLIRSFIQRQVPWPGEVASQQAAPPPLPPPPPPPPQPGPSLPATRGEEVTTANTPPPPPPPPPMLPVWQSDFAQGQWPRPSYRNPYTTWDNTSQLRADISRLQQGLGDLQRLVETCVDMQLELQRSIRQEVAGAMQRMYDAGQGKETEQSGSDGSQWTAVRKGTCCICCDKSIDSLLYRCGHMCTCLRCAQQLMQTGSNCPMCRAAIVEVIRAFTIA